MEEHQLIKKIEQLREIKPKKDWVFLTKNRILGKELEKSEMSPFSVLFIPIRKPALVVAPLVVLAAVLGGVFVYLNFLPQLAQIPVVTRIFESNQRAEEIIVSLGELQGNLEKITFGLNNLKNAKDPNQALVMTEIVKATAKKGEEVVDQIKTENSSQPKQVLASLNWVGDAYKGLGEAAGNTQIEVMGDYIEYLSQGTLTEEDETRLEKAEQYYNEGKYTDAIILIQKIVSQKIGP